MAGEITIGGLQLNFTDNGSTKVIEDITSLANALERIKEASKGGGLNAKAKQIDTLCESIDKIKTSSVENVAKLADSISKLSESTISPTLAKSISAFGTSVEGIDAGAVKEATDTLKDFQQISGKNLTPKASVAEEKTAFGELGKTANSTATIIERVREKASSFKHLLATTDGSKFATIKKSVSAMVAPFKNAESSFAKFQDKIKSLATTSIVSGLRNIKDGFVKLGSAMFGAHSFAGKLIKSFVRIAFYRSIRFALSSMVKGFKEGATNLYAWSDAFDKTRTFANNMDRIATSVLYVKNSLGAMVAPIINAVTPAIEYLSDKFVGLLNIVNEFISAFTGASTYTVAKRVATSFEDVADGIGNANKQLKSFTIGIDELNIIEDTGADGYGAGGNQKVAEDWFETKDVSNKMKDFADDVHTYVDNIRGYFEYLFSPLAWEDMKSQLDEWAGYLPTWEEGFDFWYSEIKDSIDKIGDWGADRIEDAVDAMNNFYDAVEDLKNEFKEDPLGTTIKAFGALSSVLSAMPIYLKAFDNLPRTMKDVEDSFAWIGEKGLDWFVFLTPSSLYKTVWDNLPKTLDEVRIGFDKARDVALKVADVLLEISKYVTPFPALFEGWNENLKEVKKTFEGIKKVVKKIATGDFSNLWSTFIGNESEVEDTADRWGINVTNTVIEAGVRQMYASMGAWGVAFSSGLIKSFTGAKNTGYNAGAQVASSINTGMMSKKTPLMQTASDLAYYSASSFSSAHNIEQFKKGGQNAVTGIVMGVESKQGILYNIMQTLAVQSNQEFKKGIMSHSPSKLFAEDGKNMVLGVNKGVEDYAESTKSVVRDWVDTFTAIKPTLDISSISLPNIAEVASSVSGMINASSNVTTQAMTSDLAEFFTDTLMPVITQISDDAKRQADKDEVITLDGRKVTERVNRQNKVNGYSFTGA